MRETSPMRKYSLSGITGSEALLPLRCFFFSAVMTEEWRAQMDRWILVARTPARDQLRSEHLDHGSATFKPAGLQAESRQRKTASANSNRGGQLVAKK